MANNDHIMADQMYVHYQIPQAKKHPYPIILIHGGGQTANNFGSTPDGREGWATNFLREGFAVYLVDQPGRARSPYQPEVYGSLANGARAKTGVEQRFTSPKPYNLYPQARLHTQWPGTGTQGDPAFDQSFASQVSGITDGGVSEKLNQAAVAALLDKIGPAIVAYSFDVGHFRMADCRCATASSSKPLSASSRAARRFATWMKSARPSGFVIHQISDKPWGITRLPVAYAPAVKTPEELKPVLEEKADRADLVRCYRQSEPARQLANLVNILILIVSSEASFHAPWDHCTSKYLTQAGVANQHVRLRTTASTAPGT